MNKKLAMKWVEAFLAPMCSVIKNLYAKVVSRFKTIEPEVEQDTSQLTGAAAEILRNHMFTPVVSDNVTVQRQRDAEMATQVLDNYSEALENMRLESQRDLERRLNRIHERMAIQGYYPVTQPRKKVKLKGVYAKLAKIDRPVLIMVTSAGYENRVRILYPDGRCEWCEAGEQRFLQSCFQGKTLKQTVEAMQEHDDSYSTVRETDIELEFAYI